MTDTLISLAAAKRLLGTPSSGNFREKHFYKKTGIKPAARTGRFTFYNKDEVLKWVEAHSAQPVEAQPESAFRGSSRQQSDMMSLLLKVQEDQKYIKERFDLFFHKLASDNSDFMNQIVTVKQAVSSLKTEAGAGYNLMADELNKIKMQLVEMGTQIK